MSGKRPSLAESMRQAAQGETPPVAEAPPAPAPVSKQVPSAPATASTKAAGFYAATRAGKKKVTAALDPPVHKQLKGLAVAQDTTTEALLLEAINDLFAKHGVNRSA
jgi:hypothetical protein